MTHTLELPEHVERVLEAKARRRGVGLDAYLLDLAAQDAQNETQSDAASDARRAARRALEVLAAGTRAGMPPIPDEALTSENLYAGRGEITE